MPIFVVLQTIEGKRLDEASPASSVLNRLLPFGDVSFPLLGFIDPYGNTIFNGTQMRALAGVGAPRPTIDRQGRNRVFKPNSRHG
jgi:hypothetical protein